MAQEITAPLSGTVLQVHNQVGDTVEEDQEIVIIEAMKMETPIFAPCNGIIKEVKVKEGDKVEEDDIIAVIKES